MNTLPLFFMFAILIAALQAAALQPSCLLQSSTLNRFSLATGYGWHLSNGNWSNVGQSSSLAELFAYHNLTGRPSLLELESVFFSTMPPPLKGLTMRSDAFDRWQQTAVAVAPAVQAGVVHGFMLGDELVWNNISWEQLNASAAAVKESFPSCFIFYNEGGAPLYEGRNINHFPAPYPHVPEAIDFVSSDDYGDMSQDKNTRWFYNKFLYPKLLPHQRVVLIPPTYNITCCASSLLTDVDSCLMKQMRLYLDWADDDALVAGSDVFHWSSYGQDLGLVSLPLTMACYMQLAQQLIDHQQLKNALGPV